ncbi:protein kinase (plasmid) [Gemmatirosa kalamazoonensis]|uniref:non-specific serine/threonine protein kinase n=1 Tax=Gemmatirosa kalamazoonensis TaxID=861299 RepID=W0RS53_9BACT|nr:protein kinase [Gemmatirosa kalamazoonensis]AHG92423.1 protein kinase [Gemmatirosa kalamazoonensis]
MTHLREQLQASLGTGYTIERELGGGGMSQVFVAEDTTLGRRVVVKVLPAALAAGVSIARFNREIALAARVQHPHVVPVLTAGQTGDGLPYYTMPYVEGESLRARLARGELPVADAVSVLRDVAKALDYAHGQGVTHRDIKPDNILLSRGSAVLTDFGVAKALSESAAGEGLTSVGVALGTPAYMAPEQAVADPHTDTRADIYALGVVAYEMLAGQPPFAGRNAQALLAAHATEAPVPLATLRPACPPVLAALVMRCLEKRPGDRPQTAGEILHALGTVPTADVAPTPAARPTPPRLAGRLPLALAALAALALVAGALARRAGAPVGDAIRSVAVLPFENTSGDTSYAYLEDGLADRVRDALSAAPALTVKARGSSRQLKGRDAREVGRALGVDAVVQGTVSRSRDRLHVTAELVRSATDAALWSRTLDGGADELPRMQDTIASDIAERLHVATATAPVTSARGTTNVDAYNSFLRGRYAADRLDWPHAIAHFRDAVARDPGFARAHGYLAIAYVNGPTLGAANVDSMNALASASARRALALDSTIAEAYAAQSLVLTAEMRFGDAVSPLAKALAFDSTNSDLLAGYGLALDQVGRVSDGLIWTRRAHDRDPLSGAATGIYGYALGLAGRYDAAVPMIRASLEIDPNNVLALQGVGVLYALVGRPDSAAVYLERAYHTAPGMFWRRANLVLADAMRGRRADAARQRALMEHEDLGNSPNFLRAVASIALGDTDKAMTALERSVAAKESLAGLVSLPCDPMFDSLKSDARFDALMRRVGARACPATAKWPIPRRTP